MTIDEQKYPIGNFKEPAVITEEMLRNFIEEIRTFPERLRKEVAGLSDEQLDTPYRPQGWTIRQVVNHCADSHCNAFFRIKLALTENKPTIKAYFEDRWAELSDSKSAPIQPALSMLQGIHERWALLLLSLGREELQRTFLHPENGKEMHIDETMAFYSWHANHHLAHITTLKRNKGWD